VPAAAPADPPENTRPEVDPHRVRLFAAEAFLTDAYNALSTGALLVAMALALGAGPLALSLLVGLPWLAQLAQLALPFVEARAPDRRRWLPSTVAAGRALWLVPTLLVLAGAQGPLPVAAAVTAVALSACLHLLRQNGVTVWMAGLVPPEARARAFAPRHRAGALAMVICLVAAAVVIDRAPEPADRARTFAVIGLIATALGVAGGLILRRFPDAAPASSGADGARLNVRAQMRSVAALPGLRRLALFTVVFNVGIGLPGAFWQVYMQEHLGLSFLLISTHAATGLLVRMLAAPLWGRVIARFGPARVLAGCALGLSLTPLDWIVVGAGWLPDARPLVLWDACLAGLLWGGYTQAVFIRPMELLPEGLRAAGLGLFNLAGGLSLFVSSLVGGALMRVLGTDAYASFVVLFALTAAARATAGLAGRRLLRSAG
jgi:MFS family permease